MEVICRRRTTDPLKKTKLMLKKRATELKPKLNSLKNSSLVVDEITPKIEPKKRKIGCSLEVPATKRSKLDHCQGILTKLAKHKWSGPFRSPVDPDAAGDYFQVVKHPMDFGTIKRKLQQNKYLDDEEFAADVKLIFSNAILYHTANNWVHIYATKLERLFDILWLVVKPKLTKEPIIEQNSRVESTFNAEEIGLEAEPDAPVAKLKSRFTDTILRAKSKSLNQLDNKARTDAETTKAIEVASQMKAAEEYKLKKQRQQEREAARAALDQMERSITLDDNLGAMRELEALMRSNHAYDSTWIQSKSGRTNSPLERLGLFIKPEYRLGYEDDDDLFTQDIVLEDGEILD